MQTNKSSYQKRKIFSADDQKNISPKHLDVLGLNKKATKVENVVEPTVNKLEKTADESINYLTNKNTSTKIQKILKDVVVTNVEDNVDKIYLQKK